MTRRNDSKLNSNKFDWSNALYLPIQENCNCYSGYPDYDLRRKTLKKISRNNYNCDKSNQRKSFDCINKFLASETSCNVSGLKMYSQKEDGMEQCTSEQLKQYFQLYRQIIIGQKNTIRKVEKFGCLVDNCIEDTWTARQISKVTSTPNDTTFATIGYMRQQVVKLFLLETTHCL